MNTLVICKFLSLLLSWTLIRLLEAQQTPLFNRVIDKFASCDDNYIYFTITFERSFFGVIYTDGAFGVTRCTYVNGTAFSTVKYNVTIPLNDCRSQKFPNGTRQNVIIVQQDPRILEATDNMYIVTCTPGGIQGPGGFGSSGSAFGPNQRFTLSFLGITVQGTLGSSEVITNSLTSLDYTVEVQLGQGPNGRPVDRVMNVGEPLSYVVKLRNLRNLDARIGRCWATDRGSSDIQLSDDDGCTLQGGTNIWNNFKTATSDGAGNKILYNDIKTWAFPTSNRVNILCNLHICASACPSVSCSPRNKDDKQTNGALKRRAVVDGVHTTPSTIGALDDGDSDNMIRLESGYTVSAYRRGEQFSADFLLFSNPSLITAALNGTDDAGGGGETVVGANRKVCLSYSNFIIGIVLLLVIILISFIFIIVMLMRMYRITRGRHHRSSHLHNSNTTTLHSHSSSNDDDVIEK